MILVDLFFMGVLSVIVGSVVYWSIKDILGDLLARHFERGLK